MSTLAARMTDEQAAKIRAWGQAADREQLIEAYLEAEYHMEIVRADLTSRLDKIKRYCVQMEGYRDPDQDDGFVLDGVLLNIWSMAADEDEIHPNENG